VGVRSRACGCHHRGDHEVIEEEARLHEASTSVVQFMRSHRLVERWGDVGLAFRGMMSLKAVRRVVALRKDKRPRRDAAAGSTP
jgi:hypothetical protein